MKKALVLKAVLQSAAAGFCQLLQAPGKSRSTRPSALIPWKRHGTVLNLQESL